MSKFCFICRRLLCSIFGAVLLWVSSSSNAFAQEHGSLDVHFATSSLDSLISVSNRLNNEYVSLDGFRVQIYSGSGVNSKQEAMAAQTKFQQRFPTEKVYVFYNAPFWRVRVGDFRFRNEALPLLNKVKGAFPGCYVVRDNTVKKASFRK